MWRLEVLLGHLEFPWRHRKFIRMTNLIDRCFVEERRRTKTLPRLFTEKSCLKLLHATLIRAARRWQRIKITELDLEQIRLLYERRELTLVTRLEAVASSRGLPMDFPCTQGLARLPRGWPHRKFQAPSPAGLRRAAGAEVSSSECRMDPESTATQGDEDGRSPLARRQAALIRLTEEDRRRLDRSVDRVIQKGDRSREALLSGIRELVAQCVAGRPVPTAAS